MQLDTQKLTAIDSDVVINKYQTEYANILQQNMLLSAQNDKYMGIIQYAFSKAPEAFPKDFILKEDEDNGTDNK